MSVSQGALLLSPRSCLADVSSNGSVHSFHRGIMNGIERDRGAIMTGGETIFCQRLSHLFHVVAVCLPLSSHVQAQVQPIRVFNEPNLASISGAALSPDGTMVLMGSTPARVWDIKTGEVIAALHEEGSAVSAVAFSRDGKQVVTGDWDVYAMIWDVQTSEVVGKFRFGPWPPGPRPGPVIAVALSPGGRYLAATTTGRIEVKVWDTQSGQEMLNLASPPPIKARYLAFFPDGRRFLIRRRLNETVWGEVWNVVTGTVTRTFDGGQATLSADGKRVLTRAGGPAPYKIWDAETGELIFSVPQSDPHHTPIAISADGENVIYKFDAGIRVVEARTAAQLRDISGQLVEYQGFSVDGRLMITTGRDSVYVWDISDLTSAVGDAALYNR